MSPFSSEYVAMRCGSGKFQRRIRRHKGDRAKEEKLERKVKFNIHFLKFNTYFLKFDTCFLRFNIHFLKFNQFLGVFELFLA